MIFLCFLYILLLSSTHVRADSTEEWASTTSSSNIAEIESTILEEISNFAAVIAPSEKISKTVRNLTVDVGRYNETRFLQLRLDWKPPKEGKPPFQYNIAVLSNTSICPRHLREYCENDDNTNMWLETSVMGNETSAVVPNLKQMQQLKIKPECCYIIEVTASPDDGTRKRIVTYIVPECVETVCSCDERHLPPDTIVSSVSIERNGVLNITWFLKISNKSLYDDMEITKFLIRFGPKVMKSNANNVVYNFSNFPINVNDTISYKNNYSAVIHVNYTTDEPFGVHIRAVNDRGCYSRQLADYTGTFQRTSETTPKSVPVLLIVGMAVTSLLVVGCTAFFILWRRQNGWLCQKLRERHLRSVHNWRGFYTQVSPDSTTTQTTILPHLQMKRNIIYVEEEIEEARNQGRADLYEISFTQLKLGRVLGTGAFGEVRIAEAEAIAGIPGYSVVAVKTLKNEGKTEETEEFLEEIKMLKHAGRHPNIVTLLGCCTLSPPYCMVMEYVACGNLLDYLRQLREEYERMTGRLISSTAIRKPILPRYVDVQQQSSDSDASYIQPPEPGNSLSSTEQDLPSCGIPPQVEETKKPMLEYVLDTSELLNFAVQIARGMSHLEYKNITHRDLAARNVLIKENKTLKISDFGLSRQGIYVNKRHKKVPLRWLSIEAIRDHLYTNKSDVWAFGIVLWEIGTLGGFPYPTIADYDLLPLLLTGHRLEKPENCSNDLYSMMLECWAKLPDMRPSFANILSHLNSMTNYKRAYVDFNMLRSDYTFPPTEDEIRNEINLKTLTRHIETASGKMINQLNHHENKH